MTAWGVVAAFAGMLALAGAMERHREQWQHAGTDAVRTCRWLRRSGTALVLLAGGLPCWAQGIGVGLVIWCASLAVAGLVVAVGFTYGPGGTGRSTRRKPPARAGVGASGGTPLRIQTRVDPSD